MGTRLVNRTTRTASLTADGARYLDWCRGLLADIEATEAAMGEASTGTSGRLRVDVPSRIARRVLCPALPALLARHPGLALELCVSDRPTDLVAAGIDCAIRVGELADATLVARPIGPLRMATFASPDYLARHGIPTALAELGAHALVHYAATARSPPPAFWYAHGDAERSVPMRASVTVDDAEAYVACCRAGLGLVQMPAYDARELVGRGELVEVMGDAAPAPMPMSALYPERRYTSRRVRLFVNWVEGLYATRMRD